MRFPPYRAVARTSKLDVYSIRHYCTHIGKGGVMTRARKGRDMYGVSDGRHRRNDPMKEG